MSNETTTPQQLDNNLKLSDALFDTAQAVINIGKKSGITLKLNEVYNENTVSKLAVISGLLRQMAEQVANTKINIVNE